MPFLAKWHLCKPCMGLCLLMWLLAMGIARTVAGAVTQTLPPSLVHEHPKNHAIFWLMVSNLLQTLSVKRVVPPPSLPSRRVCEKYTRPSAWILWYVCRPSARLLKWLRMHWGPVPRIYGSGRFRSSQQSGASLPLLLLPPPPHSAARNVLDVLVVHPAAQDVPPSATLMGARLLPAARADSCTLGQCAASPQPSVMLAAPVLAQDSLSSCKRLLLPRIGRRSELPKHWSISPPPNCSLEDRAQFLTCSACAIVWITLQGVALAVSGGLRALCAHGKLFAPFILSPIGGLTATLTWYSGLRVRGSLAVSLSRMTGWKACDGSQTTWVVPSLQPRTPAPGNLPHHLLAKSQHGQRCLMWVLLYICSGLLWHTKVRAASLYGRGLQLALVLRQPRYEWSMGAVHPPPQYAQWVVIIAWSPQRHFQRGGQEPPPVAVPHNVPDF